METTTMCSPFTTLALIRASRGRRAVPDRHRKIAGYRRPDRTRARFRLEGLEDRTLLSGIAEITEFPVPGSNGVLGITAGPDGNLWFTGLDNGYIGEINPTTDAITQFPTSTAGSCCGPWGITAGPNGNLWFGGDFSGKVGEINPTTDTITEFPVPTSNAHPLGIAAGPDGNLWFTEFTASQIGEINPTTHAITEIATPTADSAPCGITAGPDGNLWFTERGAGKIGMINPTTDAITEFAIPYAKPSPLGISAGPDGSLWFTDYGDNSVGMINPTTDAITEFTIPTAPSEPQFITAGPDGNLWFTETISGKIGVINPTTDAITEFAIPYTGSGPEAIAPGPDGALWFADNRTASIGAAYSTKLVVTQQPPSSVTAGSPFGLTVEDVDSSGNLVSSFNGTVTVEVSKNFPFGTLGGTTSVTATNGVATFSGLTLTRASRCTLQVSGYGIGAGTTSSLSVTPAAATQLVITQQPPATVKVNSSFGLQASIEDTYGNVVTTATNTVSVAFANNPTGATLGGTLTISASQGVATFSGLTINKVGNGYTLQVSSTGLSSATTSAIDVTKTGKSIVLAGTTGTSAPDSLIAPLVIDSPDFFDTLGLKKRGRWT
jgi:streptogramin lyase